MFERHQTKIVTFGGHPDQPMEYKGTRPLRSSEVCERSWFLTGVAGAQVLDWVSLDSEIKTAGLKDVGACSFFSAPRT